MSKQFTPLTPSILLLLSPCCFTIISNPFDGRWVESNGKAYEGQSWEWETAKASTGKYVADKVRCIFSSSCFTSLFFFIQLCTVHSTVLYSTEQPTQRISISTILAKVMKPSVLEVYKSNLYAVVLVWPLMLVFSVNVVCFCFIASVNVLLLTHYYIARSK